MKTKVYNLKGEEAGTIELPEKVFGLAWNAALVKQAITAQESNARESIAHAKGRGEVAGGGKKPWRQKGTGRARHGSIRSPIWVGGGVAHGPKKDKDYSVKINKKMRRKALLVSLSAKARDNQILILDEVSFSARKAKDATRALSQLSNIKEFSGINTARGRALLALPKHNSDVALAVRNLQYVTSGEARNLNARDVLLYRYIVIPKDSIKVLEEMFAN